MHEAILPTYFAEAAPARMVFETLGSAAMIATILVEVFAARHADSAGPRRARPYVHSLTLIFVSIFFVVTLIEVYDRIRDPAATAIMSPQSFWWAIASAVFLYWVRGVLPFLYGVFEIVVGVFAIGVASSAPALSVLGQFIALAAGVYIIIRGLDNIDRSLVPALQRKWRAFWQWPKKQPKLADDEPAI
ncbi:MAG TPA: hypothetical protein VN018_07855 [Brevundimonas sp.]|nr:hypothetical protein [Brevundimonas sp.]